MAGKKTHLDPKQVARLRKLSEERLSIEQQINAEKEKGNKADKERLKTLAKQASSINLQIDGMANQRKTTKEIYDKFKNLHKVGSQITKDTADRATLMKTANEMAKLADSNTTNQRDISKDLVSIQEDLLDTSTAAKLQGMDMEDIENKIKEAKDKSLNLSGAAKKKVDAIIASLEAQKNALSDQQDLLNMTDKIHDATIGKLKGMQASFKMMKKQAWNLMKVLLKNPIFLLAAVIVGIIALMKKFITDSFALRDSLGTSVEQSAKLNANMQGARLEAMIMGYDVNAIAAELEASFGSLDQVTGKNIQQLGRMEKILGVSTESSAALVKSFMDLTGESFNAGVDMVKFTAALAEGNNVAPGAVMKDIAANTELFADYGNDGGKNIARAAVQAKKLGVNLATTAKIADSLLDFESSIEAEMEASMMIGKQLNYNKARELALAGDVAGATADVVKQLGGQAELQKMNVLQRRALAESIGISVEEMNKLASGKVSLAPPKMTPQERMNELMEQLIEALDAFKGWVTSLGESLIGYYKSIFEAAFGESGLGSALSGLAGNLMKKLKDIFGGEGTFANKLGQALVECVVSIVKALPEIMVKLAIGIRLALVTAFVAITDFILGLGEGILNTIGSFFGWDNMGTAIAEPFRQLRDGIVMVFKSMMQGVIDIIWKIVDWIPGAGKLLGEKPTLAGTMQVKAKEVEPGTSADSAMGGMVSKEFGDLDAQQKQAFQDAMAKGTLDAFLKAAAADESTDKRSQEMAELAMIMNEVANNTGKSVTEIANLTKE